MKSGDILGGIASSTNTVTGVVSGLASNQGTKLTISAVNTDNTVGKDNVKLAEANNNFYANMGVNLGFNKSSSKSSSHSESAVVTTIKGKDKDSSITYNDVKNIEYVGTQAQNTKFIYNNVDNIDKRAVELNNSYSSDSKSSGVSTGVTIGYGDGVQTEANGVSISASKSKMNTNGTNFQNGRFINVDEIHNNTKNMTLSGFNQESGTVTGNIENLTIESKQNTSTTKGSTKGGSLSISANGLPSGSANYSKTNGERKYVDNVSTFIIGNESNLKVGKVENTAAAIGTSENGKLSIDEYVGHNLENVDKLKTAGGSVGISTSGVNNIGVNYSDRKQEGITKNTVIGNVEKGKTSGAEINKDLDTMTEMTKDRDFKTNVNIESQTIKYALNPNQFKEDLQIAIIEGKATGRTVVKTIDNVINGDKSQDIGDAERRSLIEIKEAIVRVQTAPAMDIIAEKDLADKNIQARLGVVIEKFDPNDPALSEKVKERIDELKSEGKEIVAFYDKVTKKIFINQNAKDEEVRASIAREYKIKEDLKLGRGKENDKGQLRSTVAGEIAYDEIKDRLKKGDKNPISASSFDIAKMDKDSEVTADGYKAERKAEKDIKAAESRYMNKLASISAKYSDRTNLTPEEIAEIKELERQARLERDREIAEIEKGIESIRKYEEYAKTELASQLKLINSSNYIPEKEALKARDNFLRRNIDTTKEYKEGTKKVYRDAFKKEFKDNFKEGVEGTVEYEIGKKVVEIGSKTLATVGLFFLWSTPAGGGELLPNEIKTKSDPRKIITPATYGYLEKNFPEYIKTKGNEYTLAGNYKDAMIPPKNQREKIDKIIFKDIKNFYYGTKTLDDKISESEGKLYGSLIGSTSGVITTSYGINKVKSIVNSLNGVDKLGTIEASSNKFVEPQKYSFDIAKASKNGEKINDVSKNITDKVETPKIKPVEDIIGTKTGNKELNNAINTREKGYYLKQLDEKKAPVFATISDEKLTSFQNEVSKAGTKLDLKTGELIGPKGGKGKVVGTTPDGKVVANMAGRNVIFENGKQNTISAGSFKKFEIPKTNEVVEVPTEVITKSNTKKVPENMFNGFLDKVKSKITGKPVAQVQLERIGIKSEVKDIGLKVDGTTKTGLDIDEALENNLGRTFKTYDNYDKATKTAISVKSIDMTSKTYIDGSGLNNTLNKYERAMKNFDEYELKGIYLNKDKIEKNILKIVINNEPLNKSQIENLKKFVESANKDGIKVEAVILK